MMFQTQAPRGKHHDAICRVVTGPLPTIAAFQA